MQYSELEFCDEFQKTGIQFLDIIISHRYLSEILALIQYLDELYKIICVRSDMIAHKNIFDFSLSENISKHT